LCELWEHADKNVRSACRISRAQNGSQIIEWNVRDDCLTEHDKRHERVSRYLQLADPNEERQVAEALRPILESFMRVAYPEHFPPGAMLGQFVDTCRRRLGTQYQILSEADVEELKALLEYANKFHHDTNRAYETVAINDAELTNFARRTLLFSSRG
jgi:wobble nucleotide-excising tRNase